MARLILEDGRIFAGEALGYRGTAQGEVVFNTSMCGYQEIMTDPSYHGQIVNMTYPLIGNYGVHSEDTESDRVRVSGFIVKEICSYPSSWRSGADLETYLIENRIVGLKGIDTRALTRHIRARGAMRGFISHDDASSVEELRAAVDKVPSLVGRDLVQEVTAREKYAWNRSGSGKRFQVAVLDYGVKYNILNCLSERDCELTVLPAGTGVEEIMALDPDGIFLSNGPGDPAAVTYAVANLKKLIGKKPIFGICLGHQLLCLALGARAYKLKFGHRGGNQPVLDKRSGRVEITSQNHGFAIEKSSLKETGLEITHLNLNDHTVEGVAHSELPVFSVQYHPEASPGPHDSRYLFDKFVDFMAN